MKTGDIKLTIWNFEYYKCRLIKFNETTKMWTVSLLNPGIPGIPNPRPLLRSEAYLEPLPTELLQAENARLREALEKIGSMSATFTGAKHADNEQGREVLAIKAFARKALGKK
jgi:hypothetical protein